MSADLVDLLGAMADYFEARRECDTAEARHAAAGEHSFDYWGADQIAAVERAYERVQAEWEKVFAHA
jgi:hypothetical protein